MLTFCYKLSSIKAIHFNYVEITVSLSGFLCLWEKLKLSANKALCAEFCRCSSCYKAHKTCEP